MKVVANTVSRVLHPSGNTVSTACAISSKLALILWKSASPSGVRTKPVLSHRNRLTAICVALFGPSALEPFWTGSSQVTACNVLDGAKTWMGR